MIIFYAWPQIHIIPKFLCRLSSPTPTGQLIFTPCRRLICGSDEQGYVLHPIDTRQPILKEI